MRILMISQFYPPILGGIERHVKSLSKALAARGHQVAVATLWHPGQPEFEMDGTVKIFRLHSSLERFANLFSSDRLHAPPFPDPKVMLSLRKVIRMEQPEIIHAHNWMVHSFLPLKKWSKARLVMTLHDSEIRCVQMRMMYMDRELCSGPGPIKCLRCAAHHYGPVVGLTTLAGNQVMKGFQFAAVDRFLPVSTAISVANGFPSNPRTQGKTQVIPNFIPDCTADVVAEDNQENEQLLAALPRQPYILQAGDLAADKGILVLLEAYRGLRDAPPLVLIGRRLPETPRELPPNVTILESLPHEQVMMAWRRSLFGTVVSINIDASPTVTLEAMISGKAVIGSRIGGIVDQVVDGETGLLVPPGDTAALCAAMQRLIENPEVRERMGAAGRVRVAEFQAKTVVHNIEKVYQSL
jgi:glycosyltransferase involved in cell wall biosynthesis